MCASPVLAPHGRPAPPAPATRPSHHQSKPHIHSRRDARAAAHLTSTTSPFCALCRLCTLLQASHKRLYQDAPRVRRRFCTTQGAHARTHPHARSSAQSSAQPVSLPAHTACFTSPCLWLCRVLPLQDILRRGLRRPRRKQAGALPSPSNPPGVLTNSLTPPLPT